MKDQKFKINVFGYMILVLQIGLPLLIIFNALNRGLQLDSFFWFGMSMPLLFILLTGFPFVSVEVKNNILYIRHSILSFRDASIPLENIKKYSHSIRTQTLIMRDESGKRIRTYWYLHDIDPLIKYLWNNSRLY